MLIVGAVKTLKMYNLSKVFINGELSSKVINT